MSRPIEQVLVNLIPRHPGALPFELVELASSLLAQSRNKCSNLKQEEEVARMYACANLACERLKTSLNLPPIEPRPPIPPRVYGKLYAYFDRTLVSSAARQRAKRDSARDRNASATTNSSGRALPQRLTPSKGKSFEGFQSQRTAKRGLAVKGREERDARVPRWLGPVVRLLCREMGTRGAVPHVLAGVESILCLPCPYAGGGKGMEGKLQALVGAVWFLVVVRLRGVERQGLETMARKDRVREVLGGARGDEGVLERVGSGEEAWVGWEETVLERDVNSWRKEIVGKGWRELDWFTNIGEGVGVEGEGGEDADADADPDADVVMGEGGELLESAGRRARPGTMIQEQYCITREKREAFIEWKEMMLAHIEEVMADGYLERDDAKVATR
ncbi:origin recognition complex, subunit 6 [Rhexocercosporidium sp. MPI-PUGE-AT-0058]|nr:origin recognition complex, subunit 6 [Rhexocercosporidium sp. MPI-PUGE-AT-0058]